MGSAGEIRVNCGIGKLFRKMMMEKVRQRQLASIKKLRAAEVEHDGEANERKEKEIRIKFMFATY